jgi:hypothetical protein
MARDPPSAGRLSKWAADAIRRGEEERAQQWRDGLGAERVDYAALIREVMLAQDAVSKNPTAKATEARLKKLAADAEPLRKWIVDALEVSGWSLNEPKLTKLLIDKFGAPKDAKNYDALRNRINRILKTLESENLTPRRRVQRRQQRRKKPR